MAQFQVKYGLLDNLPEYSSALEGTLLFTTDSHELFANINGGQFKVGDFDTVDSISDLSSATTTKMYYVRDIKALAVYNSSKSQWEQINADTGATAVAFSGGSGTSGAPATGEYISGASYSAATRTITFTVSALAAADVAVADSGNKFTGTDVESVLAEIQGNVDTLDGSLAAVAKSGDADDVLYAAGTGGAADITVKDALDTLNDAIGAGGSVAQQITAAIEALDGSATIASESGGVVTIKAGVAEADGKISNAAGTDITLAKVATTGAAVDVAYGASSNVKAELDKLEGDDATTGSIAKSIKDAVEGLDVSEFALASENNDVVTIKGIKEVDGKISVGDGAGISLGTAAKATKSTTAITKESTDAGLVSAQQVAVFVANEISGLEGAMHFCGVITREGSETDAQAIARVVTNPSAGDAVVMSDNAKEYIYDGTTWREVGDETEFVKKTTTIAGVDLNDNITQTELQTALGLGSAAYAATTDFDSAGAAATALSTAIGTSSDAATADTINGAKAYADSLAGNYEAAGTAAGLIANLDADVDASGTAQHSGTFVVSGVTEVDGVITAVDSVEVEAAGAAAAVQSAVIGTSGDAASANTINGAKAYADGAAGAVLGSSSDTAGDATVYGANKAAAAAQGEVDALETYVGTIPGTSQATDVIGYVQEQVSGSLAWGTF